MYFSDCRKKSGQRRILMLTCGALWIMLISDAAHTKGDAMKATVRTWKKGQGHSDRVVEFDAIEKEIGKSGMVRLEKTDGGFKVYRKTQSPASEWLWKEITYL